MNMLLKDGKNLVEQLLLMQVVQFEGGVHLVYNGMLVDKSWELLHDCGHEVSIVGESNMNMVARNDSASVVHAHVESSIDAVDSNLLSSVDNVGSVRNSLAMTRMESVGDSSVLGLFNIGALYGSEA
jgi:hypothetical protein